MKFTQLYKIVVEQDSFRLEHPRSDTRYQTFDPFHPTANQRDPDEIPEYESYDDWKEYIEGHDEMSNEELEKFVQHFKLNKEHRLKNKVIELSKDDDSVWITFDQGTYDVLATSGEDLKNVIESSLSEDQKYELLSITEKDVYISGWECTISELSEYPGTVYHYTTEDGWTDIQENGGLRPSFGTGINNRNAYGVFASISPETYADGSYGDICLAIDLAGFKIRYNRKPIDILPEPEILEAELNSALAHSLGLEDFESYVTSDMSPETVIINHYIPLKFVKNLS